jgi:hypothetical protein
MATSLHVSRVDTALDVWAYVKGLERRIEQLEAVRPRPRDRHDVLVVAALIAAALGTRFTAREAWLHAGVHPALRTALDDGFIDNPVALGLLFRRMRGVLVNGHCLDRTNDFDREGIVWRLRRCDGQPSQEEAL